MEKKWVALTTTREKKGSTITYWARRVGEDVYNSKVDALEYAAKGARKMYLKDGEEIISHGWREATKKEIKDWETK